MTILVFIQQYILKSRVPVKQPVCQAFKKTPLFYVQQTQQTSRIHPPPVPIAAFAPVKPRILSLTDQQNGI